MVGKYEKYMDTTTQTNINKQCFVLSSWESYLIKLTQIDSNFWLT